MKSLFTLALIIIATTIFAQADKINVEQVALLKEEIPSGLALLEITPQAIETGFSGNPGYMSEELMSHVFPADQRDYFSKVYTIVYKNESNEKELVLMAFQLNKPNTYFDGKFKGTVLLLKEDILVMIDGRNGNKKEAEEIGQSLMNRLGLLEVTQTHVGEKF